MTEDKSRAATLTEASLLLVVLFLGTNPVALAPLVLLALLTLAGISLMVFFYTWVYNATGNVLLCMLLHGSFNTATGFVPAPFEVLQGAVNVTLLVAQDLTLLVAVAILVVATGGKTELMKARVSYARGAGRRSVRSSKGELDLDRTLTGRARRAP